MSGKPRRLITAVTVMIAILLQTTTISYGSETREVAAKTVSSNNITEEAKPVQVQTPSVNKDKADNEDTIWQNSYSYSLGKYPGANKDYILLKKYLGEETEITVPAKAVIGGKEYITTFAGGRDSELFSGNTKVERISISNIDTNHWFDVFSGKFKGCTNLVFLDMGGCDFGGYIPDIYGSNLEGCDNLQTVITPKNLAFDIELPATFVEYGDDYIEYTSIPQNLERSISIYRKKGNIPVTGIISLEPHDDKEKQEHDGKIEMKAGDTNRKINYRLTPDNPTDTIVTWTSSNPNVATVDSRGRLTAVGAGRSTITGITDDGHYKLIIIVVVNSISVEGVELNEDSIIISYPGTYKALVPTIIPSDATNQRITWGSDDTSVVKVDQNGYITATGYGETWVYVITADGGYEDRCRVRVLKDYVPVSGVILKPEKEELEVGKETDIKVTFFPGNASDQTLEWESSNEKVAKVSNTGHVTAIGPGEATIFATASDGIQYYCVIKVVRVIIPVTGIKLTPESMNIYVNYKIKISAEVKPSNADDKTVTWTSSDPSIASVDKNGTVTTKKAGTVTIVATTNDGGFSAICVLVVVNYPPVPPEYQVYIIDERSNPYYKDKVRVRAEYLPDNRYLIIKNSDGNLLKPLISGDSTLYNYLTSFYFYLKYTDLQGNEKSDYGKLTIRMPIGPNVDVNNGQVMVVSLKDNKLDKSLPFTTGVEDGVHYVTFTTDRLGEFAILYRQNAVNINTQIPDYMMMTNYMTTQTGNLRILDSIPRTGYGFKMHKVKKEILWEHHQINQEKSKRQ